MANNGRFEYTIGFKTDENGLKKAKEELEKIQKLTINSSELKIDLKPGEAEIYAANLQNAKDSALQLYNALQNATKANGQFSATSFIGQLKTLNLKEIYSNMAKLGPIGTQAFRSMADQALKLNTYVKQSNTVLTKFGNTLYRNLEWLVSGNLINSITGVFTKAYGFTKNLDSSLNDIRIVTGKSADEMERFGREAQQTALELSKGTTDITNASLIFYQQGLDQEEVDARTEVTAKMSNVTGQSAETIADQMTAVWNGFQAGSKELEHYADVMTAVAASTASSSAELAGSISKVASIANTTGVDMEQLTAMISTVISVTRDSPETVGTAFKTIFARMDDLVEDGTDEFGVSLGRVSSHLAAMGIEILDEDGKLRDLGDTLTETGEKWSSYSREQQVAIAEQMGGKRQWNQVLALFDNWDKYSQALDVARNSTGALQEQQDIYSERVEAHLQQLKTQWEGIYQSLLGSKEILAVVDAGKNLLSVLEAIVKTAGGAVPILGSVASIMLGAFSDKVAQQIMRIKNNLILMAEAASDAALKTKVAKEFGDAASPNDKAFQAQIAYYKAAGQMTATMTEEERKRINALGEASSQKAKEVQKLVEEKKILDEVIQKWGNINEYQDLNNLNLEELKEKTAAINKEAKEAAQAFENWRTNEDFTVETLTGSQTPDLTMSPSKSKTYAPESGKVAFKPSGSAGITKEEQQALVEANSAAEKYQQALDNLKEKQDQYNEAIQKGETNLGTYLQRLSGAQDGYRLATEELQKASQGLEHFDNLTEKSKQNLQSINSINLSDSFDGFDQLNEKFQELQTQGLLSEKSIEEISAKLKAMDKTDTLQLADAWELLNQKLQESKQDFKTLSDGALNQTIQKLKQAKAEAISLSQQKIQLLEEAQFSRATQGLTQMTSAVGQLGFGLQSLSNAWKTLNNDEATGLEKFTAMIMAITQVGHATKTAINGLDNFLSAIILDNKAIDENVRIENEAIRQSEESQALKMAEAEQNERNAAARTAETGAIEAENVAKEESNIVTGEEIVEGAANSAQKGIETGARGANAAATKVETDEQTKQNVVNGVARTGNALTLASLKAIIAARLAHVKALTKETLAIAAAHPIITGIVVVITTIIAAIVAWINIKKKAEKEIEEAEQRRIETRKKLIEQNKELIKTIDENIKAWDKFSKVWDSFEEGITTIEEVKQAFQDMADQLGITEDEEYKRLMRIAEYTDDYAPLEEYLNNIISKQKEVAAGAARQNEEQYKEQLDTALEDINSEKRIESSGYLGSNSKENDKYRKAVKLLDETGAINLTADQSDIAYWTNNEISAEVLQKLTNNRDQIVEWTNSENENLKALGEEYLKLIDGQAGTLKLWQDAVIEAIEKEATTDFTDDLGKDEATQKVKLRKQIDERLESVAAKYEEQTGVAMTEEQKEKYHDELLADYAEMYPSKSEIVGAIEADKSLVPALTESINGGLEAAEKTMHYSLGRITEEEAQAIEDSLNKIDLKSTNIDWSGVVKDTELMGRILQKKGQLTDEDLEKLKQYQKETGETINYLTQDYDSLIATYDGFNSKVEKGSFDAKTFDSKAFQEFFTDDVKEEMKKFYGETSEVGKAIDIVSDKSLIGTQKWKTAWETFGKGLDEIELKKKLNEFDEVIDNWQKKEKLKDGIEVSVAAHMDGDQYQKEVEQLLNQDYSITVDIDAKIDESVDKMHDELSKVSEMAGKIGENFSVSTDDLFDLLTTFPELAQNLTYLEDGTIQLSQTAIQAMINEQKQNEKIQIQKKIDTIKEENEILQHKVDTYDKMIAAAELMANGEIDTQQKVTDTVDKLSAYSEDIQLANQYLGSLESEKISAEDIENWEKYYDKLDDENKKYWRGIIDRQKEVVANGTDANLDAGSYEFSEVKWDKFYSNEASYDYEKDGVVYGAYRVHSFEEDKNEIVNRSKELIKTYTAERDATQKILDDNKVTIAGLEAEYDAVDAKWDSLYKGMKKSTDATKDNTDATEDAVEVQQEMIDLLNEEIDAYHDVNVEIERNTTALNRLQKVQEKLTGKDLIKNYQEQIKQLDKLNDNFQEKQRLQYGEAAGYRVILEGEGVTFNDDGTIANYGAKLNQKLKEIQNDQIWYNSLSGEEQEGYKDWIKERQEEYNSLTEFIEKYENLWNKEIPDLEDEISNNLDQQLELTLTIAKAEVEIVIEKGSLRRAELDLEKTLGKVQEIDIVGNLIYDVKTLFSYYDSDEAKKIKDYYNNMLYLYQKETMGGKEASRQTLDAYKDALEQYTQFIQDMTTREQDFISNAFDRVNKKIERQKAQFDAINNLFEHDMNLVKLKYGDKAYEQLQTLYKAKEKMSKAQLENANITVAQVQAELEKARELGNEDYIQQVEDRLKDSLVNQRQAVEDYLNAVKEASENAVNAIFSHLDESIAGVSLDKMKKQWDDMEKDSEDYFDAINGSYEIEKLRNQMKKAINETDNASTQKALNTLMNDEITKLQQKDKLSKYDIERAQALFDIEQKRAAFREAQNNKSKMRLRRDASGNYSYQFVSDEDKVTSAMQDLADAQNQLYNIDKEGYQNNLQKMYEYYEAWQQELIENANASEEEKAAINQKWMDRIALEQEQSLEKRYNLENTALEEWSKISDESIDNMSSHEKDAIMNDLVPAWGSYIEKLAMAQDLIERMQTTAADVWIEQARPALEATLSGISIDALAQGIDSSVDTIRAMTISTDELNKDIKDVSIVVGDVLTELQKQNPTLERVANVLEKYENGTLSPTSDSSLENWIPVMLGTNTENKMIQTKSELISLGATFDNQGEISNYRDIIEENYNKIADAKNEYNALNETLSGKNNDSVLMTNWETAQAQMGDILNNFYDEKIAKQSDEGLKKHLSDMMDTAMYTSEVVQFLSNSLSRVYKQQEQLITMQLEREEILKSLDKTKQQTQQVRDIPVHIKAEFPNVNVAKEIELAFDMLINQATQDAFSTLR